MPVHNFKRPRGRLVYIDIESDALRDNMLGDPCSRTVAVYLPEVYDESDAHYPLMVELAAYTGSGLKRLNWQSFGENVPQRIDRLTAGGKIGPVIVAFPDAFTSLGGNQYVNSPVMGNWEDFLLREMVPRIESEFRVMKGREHRAVFGKSSGGYGALVQGMRYGDEWAAVACHSGDMGFDLLYERDMPGTLAVLAEYYGSIRSFLENVQASHRIGSSEFHALMTLAMAASYDPDPEAYLGIRLPVDINTCEIDPERWQAWLAHDPLIMADDAVCRTNLRKLKGLYFDCGSRDQYYLHFGARRLARKLQSANISHIYEEFDGTHSGIDHRQERSLPYLYDRIGPFK